VLTLRQDSFGKNSALLLFAVEQQSGHSCDVISQESNSLGSILTTTPGERQDLLSHRAR